MTDQTTAAYVPPDRAVRIAATYTPARVGDIVATGHPETVEIELTGDTFPAEPGQQVVFLTSLVDSLFRNRGPHTEQVFNFHGTGVDESHLADRVRTFENGGRVR
jgi:hypothetical protein